MYVLACENDNMANINILRQDGENGIVCIFHFFMLAVDHLYNTKGNHRMKIAIWGTGNIGKYVYQKIVNNEKYIVSYFVDSNEVLWGTQISGVKVISPKQLENIFTEELSFVLVAFSKGVSIYRRLLNMNISKFGIIDECVYSSKLELERDLCQDKNILWSDTVDKPLLWHLETNVVDNCNLNCRGCSHFSNIYGHRDKVPFDIFCRDLQKIADNIEIYSFLLLGGEPLLEDKINDYMRTARKILPRTIIQITTNGLLIPKQTKEFFECCRENDIRIIISAYKPTLRLKDKIIEILEENQISYIIRENREEFSKNIDLSGMADQDLAVRQCRESGCHFFRYGKLYKCPFEALANKLFEHYNLDIRFRGGVDIYDDKLDWNMLVDALSNEPIDACRYCGIEEKVEWCVANPPALEDWVVKMK